MSGAIFEITGMAHKEAEAYVAALPTGEEMVLEREPGNQHDRNAVKVLHHEKHVAYVRRAQAAILAKEMDKHGMTRITGKLTNSGSWPAVEI